MNQRTYSDEHGCRNSGMPLGGIGAGSLEIRPDGYFYRWCMMNNRPWGTGPATDAMERGGLRFAASCRFDGDERPRLLALGKHHGLDPVLDGWFWMSDPYHVPWVEHAREIRYRARVPIAELDYEFDDLPLEIGLTAWSPFIPLRTTDSNTPGAVLTFRIANRSARSCEVGLLGLLKNVVGYDRPDLASVARLQEGALKGVTFSRAGLPADAGSGGTLALLADAPESEVSWAIHPRHGRDLFDPLLKVGRLDNLDHGREGGTVGEIGAESEAAGPKGMQRAAVCAHQTVAAGASVEVTFLLTWHFPNFREADRPTRPGGIIGVQYANRFADATAVATWLAGQRRDLLAAVRQWRDAFDATTLPAWELDAVSSTFGVLLRAAWWDKQGRFGVWEGLGCCGLQTIDVGHYASFAILQFFPELDASMNRLSAANCEADGKVPHMMPGNFGCNDGGGGHGRIDLIPQFVLAVWRHALWTGDLEEARRHWPLIEHNLKLLAANDANGDGLPDNRGTDQTYDRFPMYGTTAFVGFSFLAALRAAAGLAAWLGDAERAQALTRQAEAAAKELDKQLWNGEFFRLSNEPDGRGANEGCLSDQLNGDWYWRLCTGEALVNDRRARRALRAVVARNRRAAGPSGWLANCTWPAGQGVEITRKGSDQANCPWSGVEYAVASHLAALGLGKLARQTAWDVFRRYEAAGMRFDHIECGEFYYRSMSAWALYLAEFGVTYDAPAGRLTVNPPKENATFLVAVPGGLAKAQWTEAAGRLSLDGLAGRIVVKSLCVQGQTVANASVVLTQGTKVEFLRS